MFMIDRSAAVSAEDSGMAEEAVRIFVVDLLEELWLSIDHGNMQPSRRMGLWDEVVGRVRSASHAPTLARFVETLAKKLGIASLRSSVAEAVARLSLGDCDAALRLYRSEPLVIVCELRARRDVARLKRAELKSRRR